MNGVLHSVMVRILEASIIKIAPARAVMQANVYGTNFTLPFWNARVEYIQQLHRLEDVSQILADCRESRIVRCVIKVAQNHVDCFCDVGDRVLWLYSGIM